MHVLNAVLARLLAALHVSPVLHDMCNKPGCNGLMYKLTAYSVHWQGPRMVQVACQDYIHLPETLET